VSARREARELRHSHVGSEHLLLGLLREDEGLAARVLASFGVTLDGARVQVLRRVASAEGPPRTAEIPFTPRATQVVLRAREEAARLGHYDIGTEHILLGLASLGESEAMNALQAFDVDAEKIRAALTELLSGPLAPAPVLGAGQRRAWRASGSDASLPAGGVRDGHGSEVARLLMSAARRALEDGRSEMTGEDLLIALTRDPSIASVLAQLSVDEAAIRGVLARRAGPEDAPAAAGES
jgi:ATP-dependent Clp protease ATP-binding subunit ClpC